MRTKISFCAALLFTAIAGLSPAARAADEPKPSHGIAIHGEPGYPPDFTHLNYVDPDAPKGGLLRRSAIGNFDNLNPYILKGQTAAGVSYVFETLMASTNDEANTEYGLVAETVETPADRSWAIFRLNPLARWHDGKPITPDDVIWSFETLREKGHPFYRYYFASVAKVEQTGERGVKFTFVEGENRELPVIIGQLPVLPKHYWESRDFDKTTLEPPLGSGPYRIAAVDPGRSIEIERVPDYWGADLPVNVGRYNFDRMRFEYYRDRTVERIAFSAGATDLFIENSAKEWATAYNFPAVRDGLVKVEAIPNEIPTGMQAFIFNIRRPLFADKRVREALAYAFDFEWTNANLFYSQYERTKSYFSNSELAARNLPGAAELEILEPYRGRIPDEVFTTVYEPPATDGTGNIRGNLREAFRLLGEAGWRVKDGALRSDATGQPFTFEILLVSPTFERIVLAFVQNLKRLGIETSVRTVDTTQYQNRMDEFDYDMAIGSFGQSLSPGNEQRDFWGYASGKTPGGRNLIGIDDPVVDELIDLLIAAPDRESLITRTRALDRVLLWSYYVIPHYHIQTTRIAYWDKFGQPNIIPPYGIDIDAWWIDPRKAAAVAAGKATLNTE